MLDHGLLGEGMSRRVFADYHREFSTGIGQNRSVVYALQVLECEWTTGPITTLQARLLGNTVRVPRHLRLLLGSSHAALALAHKGLSDFERGLFSDLRWKRITPYVQVLE